MEKAVTLIGVVLLICSTAVLAIPNRPPGIYIEPDKDIYFKPGETVMMPCVGDGYPKVIYTWKKNGKDFNPSGNDDRMVQLANSGTIVINRPEDKDEGIFQCFAQNEFGRSMTNHVNLREGKLDEFPTGVNEYHRPQLGTALTLECIPPTSYPKAQVEWVLKGSSGRNEAINYNNRVTMDLEARLHITNVKAKDYQDGKAYVCMAINYFMRHNEFDHGHFIIPSGSKPTWVQKPEDIETSEGASATFLCIAEGAPTPKTEWFVNGVPIDESTDDTVLSNRFMKPNDMNVTIDDLKLTDVFVIQCNCSNSHGYVFADVYLNVLREAPQFVKRPEENAKVAESNSVDLLCQTSGKPDPIITWYKEGQQITGGRYQIRTNGDLHINSVVLSDAGLYRCTANNTYGFVEASGSLTVRRKARIESKPGDLEVSAGSDAKFTCTGTTDFHEVLNLGVTWQKDGKNITTNDQRMTQNFQDNSLTISGTISRDSGFYTCVVRDSLSVATASAILTVKDKPDPPVDVTLIKCLQENAEVTWTKGASNNAPVQYFVVEFNTTFTPDKWTYALKVGSTQTKATLSLAPNVVYAFRVLSVNKRGQSEPSSQTGDRCTTNPRRPSQNPANVRTIGDRRNFLVVEWTLMPPIQQAGDKFEYILTVIKDGMTIHTSNINNYTINRKDIATNDIFVPYDITVKAKNEIGESNVPLITYKGYSAEDIPQVTVGNFAVEDVTDHSAIFSWDWDMNYNNVTPNTPIRGFFQGFKIQFWRRGAKSDTFREREVLKSQIQLKYGSRRKRAVTTLIYTINDLQPYTYMEAQIVVMNTYYVSPPSAVISLQTKPGVPGPVRTFTVPQVGSNFVLLAWEQPDESDRNGLIVGYDIGYQTIKGLDLGKMQDRVPQINDPYTNRTVLNGLVAKQKYRVHIWCRTTMGRGEDYFIEITTAAAGSQSVPSFDVKNVNETFFNVTWNRVISSKAGTVVYVEFRKDGASDWMQTTDEVSNNWKGVANLEGGTTYEVRLAVTNGKSRSTSGTQYISTTGIAAAYNLGANFGWFIGMMLSLLIIIAVGALIVFCRKQAQEKMEEKYRSKPDKSRMYARDGEPRGQSNDYYKERRRLERNDRYESPMTTVKTHTFRV
ncbi:Neuroglian [Mizuhopecten yessoensis]|uniref:Neuroglian n=1 Tax=Mizuhopecten yessoensis TaxID=6573 RepID=A0A210PJ48_MIZYE|nr:Neuroglian [Mizuhopecten yessoensis]